MPEAAGFRMNVQWLFATCLPMTAGWLVWAGAGLLCCAQETTTAETPVAVAVKDNRFGTPEETIRRFRHAVRYRHWRDEYECYTDRLKSRFTYFVVISTREMSDSDDLAAKVKHVFQKFHVPGDLLDRFPSMATTILGVRNDQQIDLAMKAHEVELQRRLELWTRDIYSRDLDWAGLIDELQPLFFENFRRHKNSLHSSQSGIVFHLDWHTFDRVRDLQTDTDRSEGTIVAFLRDPQGIVLQEDMAEADDVKPFRKSRVPDWKGLWSVDAWKGRARRSAKPIVLVRLTDGWKIDAVPYR